MDEKVIPVVFDNNTCALERRSRSAVDSVARPRHGGFSAIRSALPLAAAVLATSAGAQVIEYASDGAVYLNGARAEIVDGVVQPIRMRDYALAHQPETPQAQAPDPRDQIEGAGPVPRPQRSSGGWSKTRIAREIHAAADRHNVPVELFMALIWQESRYRADALSPKGAIGFAQLMPATARELGVDPRNLAENLDGGARYLAAQYRAFGSWKLALAAYNAGPHRVTRYGGVPPYPETRSYVRTILSKASLSS